MCACAESVCMGVSLNVWMLYMCMLVGVCIFVCVCIIVCVSIAFHSSSSLCDCSFAMEFTSIVHEASVKLCVNCLFEWQGCFHS